MCRADYGEGPEWWQARWVRAAKEHKCGECCRLIQPRERYQRYVTKHQDGKMRSWVTCGHCEVAQAWLEATCDGFIFGEVGDDIREHMKEHGYPWLALGRIAAGIYRQWADSRGALMPLPKMPHAM